MSGTRSGIQSVVPENPPRSSERQRSCALLRCARYPPQWARATQLRLAGRWGSARDRVLILTACQIT